MYCKKCGYEIKDDSNTCPFCGHSQNEDSSFNVYSKETKIIYKQEKIKDNYQPIEKEKIDDFRNQNGYVKLNINSWMHIVVALIGYGLMEILAVVLVRSIIGIFQSNGTDFGCLTTGDLTLCSDEVRLKYTISTCLAQLIAELLIVVVAAIIFRKKLKYFFLEFKDRSTRKWCLRSLLLMYGFTLLYCIILNVFNVNQSTANQTAVIETINAKPLFGFLFVVVAAPLFEELIFRFGIFRAFANGSKKKQIIGLIVTTLLFAFLHYEATLIIAFEDTSNPDYALLLNDLWLIPSYIIGAFFVTYSYYKSKNYATPVLVHVIWNTFSFLSIMATKNLPTVEQAIAVLIQKCL